MAKDQRGRKENRGGGNRGDMALNFEKHKALARQILHDLELVTDAVPGIAEHSFFLQDRVMQTLREYNVFTGHQHASCDCACPFCMLAHSDE